MFFRQKGGIKVCFGWDLTSLRSAKIKKVQYRGNLGRAFLFLLFGVVAGFVHPLLHQWQKIQLGENFK
jgi:hypothetical protein